MTSDQLAAWCGSDGEFRVAARYWNGGFRFDMADHQIQVRMLDGAPREGDPGDTSGVVTLSGPREVWDQLISGKPPRFATDIAAALGIGLRLGGDRLTYWQYYPALQRAVELLRPAVPARQVIEDHAQFDSPVGRYIHVELGGDDHRIYFEEAGRGIPLLLQHTAGSHGIQWRHLFECPGITNHYRLIAYDLPFHGKSLPPVGPRWWEQAYRLTADQARALPVALVEALRLVRPVYMGCSVGGLLALDLALHHPGRFRAVIALEGALKIDGELRHLEGFSHPQVSNDTKARIMEGLMAPGAPTVYRKETAYAYASGWSPAFAGDLHYYFDDFDLRKARIDTSQTAVHILSGEYDYSAPTEAGRAAHDAIEGSTFQAMLELGHFPMSEDPERFLTHLLPLLDAIRQSS
ncbi:MAG: alpha/beta hydrolase [Acidimicrobiales bacterium]|nr:alpha/beta hydrolase [Acidimicrobiales bacterium]